MIESKFGAFYKIHHAKGGYNNVTEKKPVRLNLIPHIILIFLGTVETVTLF